MKKFFNDHAAKIAVVAILILIAVFAILIYRKMKNPALTVAGQVAAEAEQAEAEKATDGEQENKYK